MACNSFQNSTSDLNDQWYNSHKRLIHKIANEFDGIDRADELVDKYLCKPLKIKKQRDPLLPKRPSSSFLFFCNEHRSKIRENNAELKMTGVMKELGNMWKNTTDQEKEKYIGMAIDAKASYEDAMETYKLNNFHS